MIFSRVEHDDERYDYNEYKRNYETETEGEARDGEANSAPFLVKLLQFRSSGSISKTLAIIQRKYIYDKSILFGFSCNLVNITINN